MKKLFTALTIIALCAGGALAFGIILGEEEGPFNIYVVKRTAVVLPSDILIDTFTDSSGVDLCDHTADTNTTGDVYHSGETGDEAYLEITASNQLGGTAISAAWHPEYWIDLNTAGNDATITYQYMQNTMSKYGDVFYMCIRGSHTGGGASPFVSSAFFIGIYNNSDTGQVRMYKVTAGSAASLYIVDIGTIAVGAYYPLKIVDNGTNIKVYADNSGTEATTLRIDYDTTDYSANTEFHLNNQGYNNTRIDTLSITR